MNVALIEFNPFHDECLYSQVLFLRSNDNAKIYLVYNRNLEDRIDYWDQIDGKLSISSNLWGIGYLRILRFLKKNNVDTVVFNSSHYSPVTRLMKFKSSSARKHFGLVHDLKDLRDKQTDILNKKMNGYFVLNDYLLDGIKQLDIEKSRITSFYPIYFPDCNCREVEKASDEIWITIPGLMESFRRDYQTLFDSFSSGALKENIKLIFLGRSIFKNGKSNIREQLEEVDKNNQCLFWDSFVDKTTFHTYMINSDYLLPLIHTSHRSRERYKDKISGTFNLGFGYKKQFVMDEYFQQFEDFRENAIFYNPDDDLVTLLNQLEKPKLEMFYQHKKWEVEYQAERYLTFIGVRE